MSALPVTTPAIDTTATAAPLTDGSGRPTPLRIVTTPQPRRPRDPLAPTSRAQALRRRAAVATVLLLALTLTTALLAGAVRANVGAAAVGAPVPVADAVVVVQPGDTVWSIARQHAPAGVSTASYAGLIVERNGLDGGAVDEWQVLRLP